MMFIDPHTDLTNVLAFIDSYSETIGVKDLNIDINRIRAIISGAVADGDYISVEKASPFKKLAAFVAYFVAEKPILSPFPFVKLKNIKNHQNAIFALEIAIDSLHGAKIHRTDREVTLDNRIVISDHSFIDIVEAISSVTPLDGKKLVAVLLEQMCYRTNPECEYS